MATNTTDDAVDGTRAHEALRQCRLAMRCGDWVQELSCGVVSLSEEAAHMLGVWPMTDLPGEQFVSLIHSEDQQSVIDRTTDLAIGVTVTTDYRAVIDGQVRYFQDACTPIAQHGPLPTHLVGCIRDMTPSTHTERVAREQALHLAAILDSTSDGVLTIDNRGKICTANRSAYRIFGYEPGALVGQNISVLMPSHHRERHDGYIHKAETTGHTNVLNRERDVEGMRRDGTAFPLAIRITKMPASIGGFVGCVQDISPRKNAATANLRLAEQLRRMETLGSLGRLARSIAHDLNNTLTPVMVYGHALQKTQVSDEHKHKLEVICSAAQSATDLVASILKFSHSGAVKPRPIELGRVLRELAILLKASAPKTICIHTECEPGLRPINADPAQLHQLLMNLCVNGIYAMDSYGTLSLRVYQSEVSQPTEGLTPGMYAVIEVTDDGAGIDADVLPHIFDPFFSTKGTDRGTGIGLDTVRHIVRAQKGAIRVSSTVNVGTTFTIWIPLTPQAASISVVEQSLAGTAVLLVDDDAIVLATSRQMLEHHGCVVGCFESSREALEVFRGECGAFEVAVLDHHMPAMSGVELAASLRDVRADLPVVLCTADLHPSVWREASLVGVSEVLTKPFSPAELADAVTRALRATTS